MAALVTAALVVVASATGFTQDAAGRGGREEGINVRGEWTLEVRDPDGTLVSRHEFRNALVLANAGVTGNGVLAGFLGRHFNTVGDWRVVLAGPNGPCGTSQFESQCTLVEATHPSSAGSTTFKNLTLTLPTETRSFPAIGARQVPTGTLELSGLVTAGRDGSIRDVATTFGLCSVGTNCFLGVNFTSHTLAAPVPVVAGQFVQVKVTFSFN